MCCHTNISQRDRPRAPFCPTQKANQEFAGRRRSWTLCCTRKCCHLFHSPRRRGKRNGHDASAQSAFLCCAVAVSTEQSNCECQQQGFLRQTARFSAQAIQPKSSVT